MFYLTVKKQILFTQLLLKALQFVALWFFSTIHTTEEMGKWSYSFSVIAITTTIFGLGNNISLKSNHIISNDKLRLISLSVILYLLFSPLLICAVNVSLPIQITVLIVLIGFLELFRIQSSIYLFNEKKLYLGNLVENMPLLLGIIFAILFQFLCSESFLTRILGYACGYSFIIYIGLKSLKLFDLYNLKQVWKHVNWLKYFYLLNVALLLSYDKLFIERINISFLGVYSVNFVIITSLGFITKYIENLIVGSAVLRKELFVARAVTILMGIAVALILPFVFQQIDMDTYILTGPKSQILMFMPYAFLELSIAQNRLYKSNSFRDPKLTRIFLPTIILYSISFLVDISETWVIIGYIMNILITVILIRINLIKSKSIC